MGHRTSTHRLTTTAMLTGVLALAACGSSDDQTTTDPAVATTEPAAADSTATTQSAAATDSADDADAPVDVCSLLTTAEVSALLEDDLREPRSDEPTSYSLGACSWTADNNGRTLYVSARALDQWDSALAANDFGVDPVDDLGARAHRTSDDGLFVDPGDRNYFYQLFVIGLDGNINFDMGVDAAQLLLD